MNPVSQFACAAVLMSLMVVATVIMSVGANDTAECSRYGRATIGGVIVIAGCQIKAEDPAPPSEFTKELREYQIHAGRSF